MQLDYAHPGRAKWWRRHRRLVFAGPLSIILAGCAWWLGARWSGPIQSLYIQHRAVSYNPPADSCAIRANATKVANTVEGSRLNFWNEYFLDTYPTSFQVPLFVGRRTSPANRERIVTAYEADLQYGEAMTVPNAYSCFLGIKADVLSPAGVTAPAIFLGTPKTGLQVAFNSDEELQIYGGYADLADPSHFTIGYKVGDQRGIIDGFLQNDDTVKLSIRNGPALGTVGLINRGR